MFPNPRPVVLENFLDDDSGMVTPEYSVGIIAAVALALTLYAIARSDDVRQLLTDLIHRALNVTP